MQANVHAEARPEAMGDVPGICELPLTRAVVQYRDIHEVDTPGGRIEDIGLALVVEGRYAATAEVVCPEGTMAVTGGWFIINLFPSAPPTVLASYRPNIEDLRIWRVSFLNPGPGPISAQGHAYCAPTGG